MRAERLTRVFSSTRIPSKNENMMRESGFLKVFVLVPISDAKSDKYTDMI